MTEPTPDGTATAVESLARRLDYSEPVQPYDEIGEAGIHIVRVHREDEHLTRLNLESWRDAPVRPRGMATVYDAPNFVDYVQRLADDGTTIWGHEGTSSFTAVFNDHNGPDAGWRDHKAVLQLQNDPEWDAFAQRSGVYMNQIEFAEFLQDYAPLVVEPDGATLLEVSMNFRAHRKAEFESVVDLETGDVSFSYTEQTNAKTVKSGQIEVPREFTVSLSPYLGLPPVTLTARLKFDVSSAGLRIGFRLVRPDLVRRDAFADIRNTIVDGLKDISVLVLLGEAPKAVAAQQ